MPYSLRPYQQKVVDYALPRLRENPKPLLVSLGTGGGKTWCLAELAKQWGDNVLILTVSRELCQQDYEKLCIVAGEKNVGMFSASWNKKEIKPITVGTIQSVYRHPELWSEHKLIILDEADSFPLEGMLAKIIEGKRIFALTATTYGTQGSWAGTWYTTKLFPMHRIKSKTMGWFWQPVEMSISERELTDDGYLCPTKIYSSPIDCSMLRMNSNGSEYNMGSVNQWMNSAYERVLEVMMGAEKHGMCHSGIVFLPSVEACEILENMCIRRGIDARAVSHKTPKDEREHIIENHKAGDLRWIINMGVCCRGFDNPQVDCLVIARPTMSLRLHRQILGRGIRVADGKKICNILDLTNNCRTWGGPRDVVMGKKGWSDTILLNGKDISGMAISSISLDQINRARHKDQDEQAKLRTINRRKKYEF